MITVLSTYMALWCNISVLDSIMPMCQISLLSLLLCTFHVGLNLPTYLLIYLVIFYKSYQISHLEIFSFSLKVSFIISSSDFFLPLFKKQHLFSSGMSLFHPHQNKDTVLLSSGFHCSFLEQITIISVLL
jgi:hypothetical protein